MLLEKSVKAGMNDSLNMDQTNTLDTRKQAGVWWSWGKSLININFSFGQKNGNFYPDILLFRGKISGRFTRTSGHDSVQDFYIEHW